MRLRFLLFAILAFAFAGAPAWAQAPIYVGPASTPAGIGAIGPVVNIVAYGAAASAADNATALQAAINAAQTQGIPLYIPAAASCYKYTAPLSITSNLSVIGDFVHENWAGGINVPLGLPPLQGSVLCPSSNGSDGIDISGTSLTVNISNIGMMPQTFYSGTGHGIYYVPASNVQGLSGATWTNVKLFGFDGNHYSYDLTNFIYDTFASVYSYGGGGFSLYGNGTDNAHQYGNSVFINPYVQTIAGGSAHAIYMDASRTGELNLLTFIRPQATVESPIAGLSPSPGTAPTNAQYDFYQGVNTNTVRLISPDFESVPSITAPVLLQANNGNSYDYDQTLTFGGNNIALTLNNQPVKQALFPTGQQIAAGSFNGATSGSVTFDQPFRTACLSVVLTGWGHTANLSAACTNTGFTYTQTASGATDYFAYGY